LVFNSGSAPQVTGSDLAASVMRRILELVAAVGVIECRPETLELVGCHRHRSAPGDRPEADTRR
jgi:hypothetical protein